MKTLSRQFFILIAALYAFTWAYRLLFWVQPWSTEPAVLQALHWAIMMGGASMIYILITTAGMALVLSAMRRWRWVLLACIVIAAEVGVAASRTTGPYLNSAGELRGDLLVANYNMQANVEALTAFAATAQAYDVIKLSEIPRRFEEVPFDRLFPNHELVRAPYRRFLVGRYGSSGVLVRKGMRVEVHPYREDNERPIFDVRLEKQGRQVRVLAVHPLVPFYPEMHAYRNGTLDRLRDLAAEDPAVPTLIMGDMNTTPFEVDGWRLPGKMVGNPLRISWSGIGNLYHVRIDHIRLRQGQDQRLSVREQRVGPDFGSDHLPNFVSLDFVD